MHEGRATGAEPDTSSWQGGKLLEMTAAGRGGGGGGRLGRVVSCRLTTETTVCWGNGNRAAQITVTIDVRRRMFQHWSN